MADNDSTDKTPHPAESEKPTPRKSASKSVTLNTSPSFPNNEPQKRPSTNDSDKSATSGGKAKRSLSFSMGRKASLRRESMRSSLLTTNKVGPAPEIAPAATLNATEVAKVRESTSAPPPISGIPLTVLPSKVAFSGGLAVSSEAKGSKGQKPTVSKTRIPSVSDGIKAAASRYRVQKAPTQYEVNMPRIPRYSERRTAGAGAMRSEEQTSKIHINPRTLGSLVNTLKAIYGTNFQATKKKKKKAKKTSDSESDEIKDKKEELTDDRAETLAMKLYGNQSNVIKQFLDERRDCERELVFKEATIPKWVKIFWKVHFIYEFISSCLLLVSVFYGTYSAIFRNHNEDMNLLEFLSLFIEVDVIIRLLVEAWRSKTKCQYEVFTVNYTFILAILDGLATIPFAYYYLYFIGDRALTIVDLQILPLFSLFKICHAFRMTKILVKLENDMNIRGHAKFIVSLMRYIIQYLLVVHILSCIIFWVGGKSYLDWLLNRNSEKSSERELVTFLSIRSRLANPPEEFLLPYPDSFGFYILSVYLVVATISTVGFGDFFAVNNTERILIIFMMMIGAIWISGELAYNLGTFFTDLDSSRYMMFFRVKCIKIHLQNYRVSNFLCTRTENYYRHLWRYRKGVHEIDLSYLPHCVQEELKFDICEEMFHKSPIFRGLDETFLMGLAKTAKVSLYVPDMILFERGSITKQMCFVLQGEVAVAAGLYDNFISAIHRPGCLIGEINLFMALPCEQTIYTRTVCTIMTITKKDLMLSLQDYPHIFAIMRQRIKQRRERYRNAFNLVQVNPYVQWMYPTSLDVLKSDPEFPVKVNNMKGWRNAPVTGYPMEDENEQVIIEMPCTRPDLKRLEARAYRLVSVPEIYYDPGYLLTTVNCGLLLLYFYMCWITPICWTFDDFEGTYFSPCKVISLYWPTIIVLCVVDFVFELFLACPSTGIYYKIKDGLTVKIASFGFYCDALSIIPFELLYPGWFSPIFRMLLKHWKIARFWEFLDERFALKLFFIRIAKMTYYLLYLTYVIALFLICLACEAGRGKECNEISFFNPAYPKSRWQRVQEGQNFEQYVLTTPIVYAASTITSVGFGNIFPQTVKEVLSTICIMILGHFFVSYILAQLTSALSARLTPKLLFHQKLLVVETFIRHNGLSSRLLRKLIEHYDLQHQYVSGCSLPEGTHLMYDAGKVLLEDVFLVEGEIFFDGVPAFSKISSQAIIDISRLMHRFVVPPNLIFVQRGEVRRVLYVIVNGSVALYQHDDETASAILTSTGHFGLRDLLFGEPYPYIVKTLSYVVLYAVDYSSFQEVLGDDEGLMEYINDEMARRTDEIGIYSHTKIDNDVGLERDASPSSWITYPNHPGKPLIGGDLTYNHFERPFLYYIGSNFIREKTMSDILHPAGKFGIKWQAVMGLAAVANFVTLIMEMFIGYKGPNLRYFELFLDLLFCADIYIKFHWAYYSYRDGEMRYHPVRTWCRYIFRGPFFIEVAMMIPLEFIMVATGSTNMFGYGAGHSWFMKLRWIRFLRCYKFVELYVIVHRIFENRTTVMFLFYLSITVLMCYILSALAFYFACPTFGFSWSLNDEYKMPVCLKGTWANHKATEKLELRVRYKPPYANERIKDDDIFYARTITERSILGLYYVGQVLMVIGFGDLATFRRIELNFLCSVALFGFIVCQAIVSDITSAQIDTDEIRAINREKLERLGIALSREEAPKYFTKYVRKAFRLSWSYAKGLQPNDLFNDLHPILHRELISEYIGDVLDRVPIFMGFTDTFINALKVKLKIEYYPKGSVVTKVGDSDYRMYIVVKGNIWVCERENRWLCTMSVGETIGEMSLVYAAKRRFSAYAATNLQLLVLEAFEFAHSLEQFPLTRKEILKSLLRYKRETYLVKAWKWKAKDPEGYNTEQEENTNYVKKFFVQKFSHIPVKGNVRDDSENLMHVKEPKWYQSFIGYGRDEIVQHYIYFSSDSDKFNFVIHPACLFISHFRTLVQVVRFSSPVIALFHIFFYFGDNLDTDVIFWTTIFARIFDVILWLNIILRFFTAVEVAERKTHCKDLKKIITHFLLQPQGFILHVLVAFPYDLVTGNKATPLMYWRCLLSIKFFSDLWKLKDNIEVSTLMFKLIISVSFLLYLAHIMACIFFWLSCHHLHADEAAIGIDWTKKCLNNGWVYKFRIEFGKTYGSSSAPLPPGTEPSAIKELYDDPRPSHWYVISLYWVMAVLTTCGFGDITPTNFDEISLAVFCIFFGSLFLSIMLGNITTGLSSGNKAKREYLGRVEKMLEYLEVIGLSNVGHQTLGAYCNMTWNNCRGVNYNDIADILPLYVQQDVYLALYHKYVTNCLFFGKDYDIAFVRAVCSRLRHYMFLPGMRIANELEPGSGICIVMRGAVTSFQQNPETGEYEFIKRYEERQVFGRIPALYPGSLYNKSYRAEEKTEILTMYHADMRQLLMKYPRWRIFLRQMISREYSSFSKHANLKNITERRLELDEKLTKDLTFQQFREAASLFAAAPPDRSTAKINLPKTVRQSNAESTSTDPLVNENIGNDSQKEKNQSDLQNPLDDQRFSVTSTMPQNKLSQSV